MHSRIYLVMCLLFFYCSATSACALSESCSKKEWLLTDCDQCCKMGASPVSAVQKRSLCCPTGDDLAQCMSHCNFTKDDVERKEDCTVQCPKNCTGGFHFATTTSTTATTTTTTTAQTTSVPTITTVSSDFIPVYLSSIKKPIDEKSLDHKVCTARNNHVKAAVPLLVWLPLLGALVGSTATVCIFWISRRKQRKVKSDTKTSVKRNGQVVPMYNTAYDKDLKIKTISNNTRGKSKTRNSFGNNLAF